MIPAASLNRLGPDVLEIGAIEHTLKLTIHGIQAADSTWTNVVPDHLTQSNGQALSCSRNYTKAWNVHGIP